VVSFSEIGYSAPLRGQYLGRQIRRQRFSYRFGIYGLPRTIRQAALDALVRGRGIAAHLVHVSEQ
jgi:hypothetical protein